MVSRIYTKQLITFKNSFIKHADIAQSVDVFQKKISVVLSSQFYTPLFCRISSHYNTMYYYFLSLGIVRQKTKFNLNLGGN